MEIIGVRTGKKYSEWWAHNLEYMLHRDVTFIDKEEFGGVYDKLQMFREFKTGEYLYFDLDVIIKGPIDHLLREDFTLLHAWWRPALHTPLNSSIMSWKGDQSHIYEKFAEDPDLYMVKYWKGIDEYIYKEIKHKTYGQVCWSYNWDQRELDYPVCLFNQTHNQMKIEPWTQKYLL